MRGNSKNVKDYVCPVFILGTYVVGNSKMGIQRFTSGVQRKLKEITIGGFNMSIGPYDMWSKAEGQYDVFANVIEHMIKHLGVRVVLISHTNGFELPPHFKLINERDYPILKEVIGKRKIQQEEELILLDGPYLPNMTKTIIGKFNMMVTGRVHASVGQLANMYLLFSGYMNRALLRVQKCMDFWLW